MHSDPAEIEAPAAIPLDCPSCGLPAQIVDRFTLPGSAGAVEHLKIVCTAGHSVTPPIDSPPPGALRGDRTGRHHGILTCLDRGLPMLGQHVAGW